MGRVINAKPSSLAATVPPASSCLESTSRLLVSVRNACQRRSEKVERLNDCDLHLGQRRTSHDNKVLNGQRNAPPHVTLKDIEMLVQCHLSGHQTGEGPFGFRKMAAQKSASAAMVHWVCGICRGATCCLTAPSPVTTHRRLVSLEGDCRENGKRTNQVPQVALACDAGSWHLPSFRDVGTTVLIRSHTQKVRKRFPQLTYIIWEPDCLGYQSRFQDLSKQQSNLSHAEQKTEYTMQHLDWASFEPRCTCQAPNLHKSSQELKSFTYCSKHHINSSFLAGSNSEACLVVFSTMEQAPRIPEHIACAAVSVL